MVEPVDPVELEEPALPFDELPLWPLWSDEESVPVLVVDGLVVDEESVEPLEPVDELSVDEPVPEEPDIELLSELPGVLEVLLPVEPVSLPVDDESEPVPIDELVPCDEVSLEPVPMLLVSLDPVLLGVDDALLEVSLEPVPLPVFAKAPVAPTSASPPARIIEYRSFILSPSDVCGVQVGPRHLARLVRARRFRGCARSSPFPRPGPVYVLHR